MDDFLSFSLIKFYFPPFLSELKNLSHNSFYPCQAHFSILGCLVCLGQEIAEETIRKHTTSLMNTFFILSKFYTCIQWERQDYALLILIQLTWNWILFYLILFTLCIKSGIHKGLRICLLIK